MRHRLLFQGSGLTLLRADHPPGTPHRDPDREESAGYTVSWLESGSFGLRRGSEAWRLSAGAMFITRPGLRYRCSHESETPDDVCLSLEFPEDLVREAVSFSERPWDTILPVASHTPRLTYLRLQLLRAFEEGVGPLAIPALAPEILASLLEARPARRPHRPSQLSWYVERVDAARHIMESRFAEPLTMEGLGREVGLSTFHFSRVFRDLAGVPPHRYLVKVRLSRAAASLREGSSVTRAGLDAGFPSLSQFIRQFHRAYGVTPSRYVCAASK